MNFCNVGNKTNHPEGKAHSEERNIWKKEYKKEKEKEKKKR